MSGPAEISWRPNCDVDTVRVRAGMLSRARHFFEERDILEVATPALGATGVTDPNIETFAVRSSTDTGAALYLQTSPEYYMKRLLCAGYPDMHQICHVFRDGESGKRHQPEFTLAEWYRLGFGLRQIMQETVDFVLAVISADWLQGEADFTAYRDAFREIVAIDPLTSDLAALRQLANADAQLRQSLGDDRDAWLDLLLTQRISVAFPGDRLTVLYHYPASQGALARLCPGDDAVADRFEVFCGAVELANGFVELTDADEQRDRFARDNAARDLAAKPWHAPDERLLAALGSGLPDCAGVAVGLDRLLMLRERSDDIRSVQTFSIGTETGNA